MRALADAKRWLDGAVAAAIVAAIVAVALGSSSVSGLVHIGHGLRWVALLMFAAVSVASYVATGARRRIDRFVVGAGAVFLAVMFLSVTWSVLPRLTAERALSLGVIVAGVAAAVVGGDERRLERIADGIFVGAVVVVAMGVPVLLFAYGDAVQGAFENVAPRYRGIGENPNTVSMLAALALPLAIRYFTVARRPLWRIGIIVAVAGLVAQIGFSGSRGALVAAVAGCGIALLLPVTGLQPALLRVATLVAVTAVALLVTRLALPTPTVTAAPVAPAQPPAPAGSAAAGSSGGGRLEDELGAPQAAGLVGRPFGSGRFQAWAGAVRQAEKVPLLGYGFGTEDRVFIDRYYTFQGSRPENSLVGVFLQIGVVGLAVFLALLVRTAANVWRRGRRRWQDEPLLTSAFAAFCAGVLLMGVQSYAYSAGNIAALSFWLCVGMCAVAASVVTPTAAGTGR